MLTETVIFRNARQELATSEDYAALRKLAIDQIEKLAHELWTDYNVHDPGMTILELFSYAITDIGYRTGYEVRDLLTKEEKGVPRTLGQFHTAREVLSSHQVTFDDLRKMLIDIRGIRNASVFKHESVKYCIDQNEKVLEDCNANHLDERKIMLNGLYEVCLEFEEFLKKLSLGEPDISCAEGDYDKDRENWGVQFEIIQSLVLAEICVYANTSGKLTVKLLDHTSSVLQEREFDIHDPFEKTQLELDWELEVEEDAAENTYQLLVEASAGMSLFTYEASYPLQIPGFLQLVGTTHPDAQMPFFDWQIAPSPSSIGAPEEITAHVGLKTPAHAPSQNNFVVPKGEHMVFDVEHPLCLESVRLFSGGVQTGNSSNITLTLLDEAGEIMKDEEGNEFKVVYELPKESNNIEETAVPLNWKLPPCQNVRLIAESDGVQLSKNPSAPFPFIVDGVISLLGEEKEGMLQPVYNYFYDWIIRYEASPETEKPDRELTKAEVLLEVKKRLYAARNLCEDLISIRGIETIDIGIDAAIDLHPGVNPDEVLAEIYCKLENHVKPPVHFYSLQQMLGKGKRAEDIFDGPRLSHGFIDDEEFQLAKARTEIRTSDVVSLVMEIEGVLKVRNVLLKSFRKGQLEDDPWLLCLPKEDCVSANFEGSRSGIGLYQNGIRLSCQAERVEELLEEKRLLTRPQKINGFEGDCEVPVGQDRELADFYPMQNELPATYLVGPYRVPDSFPAKRKAQSRQLKAFLMFFEQLLANYFAQLANIHELFNWTSSMSDKPIRTYFTQEVSQQGEIADLIDIYTEPKEQIGDRLAALIETDRDAYARKNRFLDHLLARFTEDFADYSLLMYSLYDDDLATSLRLICDKEVFLQNYPVLSRERNRAFDYTAPLALSGYQQRVYKLLGIQAFHPISGIAAPFSFQQIINKGFKIELWHQPEDGSDPVLWFESIYVESERALEDLFDLIIALGGEENNYSAIQMEDDCGNLQDCYQLNSPCADDDKPILGYICVEDALNKFIEIVGSYTFPSSSDCTADLAFHPFTQYFCLLQEGIEPSDDPHDPSIDPDAPWYFAIKDIVDGEEVILFESERCDTKDIAAQLLQTALRFGHLRVHYKLSDDKCSWILFWECDGEELEIGKTLDLCTRKRLMDLFAYINCAEGFYAVEHILLRKRIATDPFLPIMIPQENEEIIQVKDPYSFRMTIVLPAWSKRFKDMQFRCFVEEVLRREAPAHIYVHIVWIDLAQMTVFEPCYLSWLDALRKLPKDLNGSIPYPDENQIPEAYEEDYGKALAGLLDALGDLKQVYPSGRLSAEGPEAQGQSGMTLGRSSLGTI